MTSDTNPPLSVPAFLTVEPEPAPPFESEPALPIRPASDPGAERAPAGGVGGSRRTRLVVNAVLATAFVLLVGGVAFAIGRATAPATLASADGAANGSLDGALPGGANGQLPIGPGDGGDGRPGPGLAATSIRGTVRAMDADSITLELSDGTTVSIAIDSDTDYHRQADASASDVSTGSTVIVGIDGLGFRDGTGATADHVTIVP